MGQPISPQCVTTATVAHTDWRCRRVHTIPQLISCVRPTPAARTERVPARPLAPVRAALRGGGGKNKGKKKGHNARNTTEKQRRDEA